MVGGVQMVETRRGRKGKNRQGGATIRSTVKAYSQVHNEWTGMRGIDGLSQGGVRWAVTKSTLIR